MKHWVMLGLLASMSGCASLSGFDGRSSFACQAPDGVLCESMSGIYANASANNLPGQQVSRAKPRELSQAKVVGAAPVSSASGVMTTPIYSGTPIRSAPRVLRVWFAPWEDSDGDLHDQSYVYLPVDAGRWLIEHNRRRIQDQYQPVRPPSNWSAKPGTPAVSKAKEPAHHPAPADASALPEGVHQMPVTPAQAEQFMQGIMGPTGSIQGRE